VKVAVCSRPDRPAATEAAAAAAQRIRGAGHEVSVVSLDDSATAEGARGAEVACVFGGDGTMLRAARALAPLGIPLLGVNLGRLGFLTVTSVDEFDGSFAELAAGRYTCEERALLEAQLLRGGREVARARALNDVVVARGKLVRAIHVDVRIDDDPFTVYWADGIIVATPTGSTAYAFSAGGPLLLPDAQLLMLVPIAPHLSFGNALVLDADRRLRLEVLDEPARLSIDGQEEHDLVAGDRVEVRLAGTAARFVRTSTMRPFLSLLRRKILKEDGAAAEGHAD
jgi:NAD+ kinase